MQRERVRGHHTTGFPKIDTRTLYAEVTNSIAKKGVQRVEDPSQVQGRALPESRGRASGASYGKELL